MESIISIQNVSKQYLLGASATGYYALREAISEAVRRGWRKDRTVREPFWALHEVSFDVQEGETLGIIGRNGAGKSTLLKIISQITQPTAGEIHLFGRVSSLLEVGVGFHQELTGRENIYLNGAILGMSKAEIRRKFDEIVEFSEIGQFLETPVKRYSSGMYVRLAFAVAAHLEPEVLIVDEVLSVGDASFQKKCIAKMDDIHSQGRSILVVSHNMGTIADLCDRAVWLASGQVREIGSTSSIIQKYLSDGVESSVSWNPKKRERDDFHYNKVEIVAGEGGESSDSFPADASIDIVFDFTVERDLAPGRIIFRLSDDDGQIILSSSSSDALTYKKQPWGLGPQRLRCTIPGSLLVPGQYYVSFNEFPGTERKFHDHVLTFTVSEQNSLITRDRRPGIIAPMLRWVAERG